MTAHDQSFEYRMNPDADAIYRRFAGKAKFRHLSLLIQLHDLRNMKRAAEALGLSQPAVSLAVSELEKLLGVTLFLRHARGVEPTQTATDLVPVARRILAALGDGAEVVSNSLNDTAGFVRIAATPAATSALLQPRIGHLARKYPSVHLDISEINAANPFEAIANGSCDFLCLRKPQVTPEEWTFVEVVSDALVVVCGAGHALAKHGPATTEDLRNAHWLITRRGSVARNRFEDLAEEIGLPTNHRSGVVTHVPSLTLELLTRHDYLALIPRSVALPWIANGWVAEVDSPAMTRLEQLGFAWQPDKANHIIRKLAGELSKATQQSMA